MMVNNSQTDNTYATIQVRGRRPRLHQVGWLHKETPVGRTEVDFAVAAEWLAPGQMVLYRVQNEAS